MKVKKIAIAFALALGLTVPSAWADASFAVADANYLGFIKDGIPANELAGAGYINVLTTLAAGDPLTAVQPDGQRYDRIGSTLLDPVGGWPVANGTAGNFSTGAANAYTGSLGTGWTYLLGKYDGPNAGTYVWYVLGESGNFTMPRYLPNPTQYEISHYTLFNPTSVPDGGVTLMLLGGALVGLETLRRKFRA